MIFQNARCIFPDGIRDGLEVVVEDGRITAIRRESGSIAGDVIDLAGNYLAAGFVDLHVHGAVGHDTMEASSKTFRAICDYHASGGTTSLLLTTATAPIAAIVNVLDVVRGCLSSIKQIAGVHVEGPFISKNKHGAQREEFIQEPTPQATGQLLAASDVVRRVTLAPEIRGAVDFIDKLCKQNISISGGHSDAWEDDVRPAFVHGMRSVTHTFNCMSSARRRGIYRVGGLLEFALSEPEISCELIADGHHVSATLMKMLYRAKGARGICLVTDATAGAGLPNETNFSLGGLDCVVRDGVSLLADGSALAGSTARMIDLIRTLVKDVGVPLHEAITMATQSPAGAIGLEAKGQLKIGADADLAVVSPNIEVLRTFAGGEEIFSR
jgi:N-acetylglucosamine-6-phosphate deacetylase